VQNDPSLPPTMIGAHEGAISINATLRQGGKPACNIRGVDQYSATLQALQVRAGYLKARLTAWPSAAVSIFYRPWSCLWCDVAHATAGESQGHVIQTFVPIHPGFRAADRAAALKRVTFPSC